MKVGTGTLERLRALVGRERPLAEVSQALHFGSKQIASVSCGAILVTCSDESELECERAFQHGFVQHVLPPLKFANRAPFRLANLGGRYEWGAVRLAEDHFATRDGGHGRKLLVCKVNAHVAFEGAASTDAVPAFRLGIWRRYGRDSNCCGALKALLAGQHGPFVDELRHDFESEGHDRIGALSDPRRIEPLFAPLYAAVVSARLQARKVVLDVQDHTPVSPTCYVILPCVTVNRHERDTEIVCGVYTIDSTADQSDVLYYGLGDDPAAYDIERQHNRFTITDDQLGSERTGRDHREMARAALRDRTTGGTAHVDDERLSRVRADVARNRHHHHHHARTLLRIALPILAEVAPVPVAIMAFADGAVGIHHAWRVHKLAREMEGTDEARRILAEIEERVDQLDGDRARALLELLMADYGR